MLAIDHQLRDGNNHGAGGADERLLSDISGTRATFESSALYNTSSDFSRIRLAVVRPTQEGEANRAAPQPLFAFVSEMTLSVNNNTSPNKAIGILGAFDMTAGTFEVSGSVTAYFTEISAIRAVRSNADVTLDWALVKDFGTGVERRKTGIYFDIPLIGLGNGRLNVTQDEPITIPLENNASEYIPFGHTLMLQEYEYLPIAADT